jgi:hypothetical protein
MQMIAQVPTLWPSLLIDVKHPRRSLSFYFFSGFDSHFLPEAFASPEGALNTRHDTISYLKNASDAPWRPCESAQNAHILSRVCGVFSPPRALPCALIHFFEIAYGLVSCPRSLFQEYGIAKKPFQNLIASPFWPFCQQVLCEAKRKNRNCLRALARVLRF